MKLYVIDPITYKTISRINLEKTSIERIEQLAKLGYILSSIDNLRKPEKLPNIVKIETQHGYEHLCR